MKITLGYELEVGDVRRDRKIPEKLGAWEYAETAIVNFQNPYRHVAGDPLGKDPPVGGEINVYPGHTPAEVAERIMDIVEWFEKQGDDPTVSCISHGHIHVRLEGLRDDIKALKKLTRWIGDNQDELIKRVYQYQEHPWMRKTKTARSYLKWDGGRPMPVWMVNNIVEKARTFEDFIRIQCCGKDGVSQGRPFRYAVNTYCLKHNDTIEFRCFRSSLKYKELLDSIRLARAIVVAAISDGETIGSILDLDTYTLPPFWYDHNSYVGWENTKYGNDRGKKERYFRAI